jgi:hypothetical protein
LLRHALGDRIGKTGIPADFVVKLWLTAGIGAGLGYAVKLMLGVAHPVWLAVVILSLYGIVYFGGTSLLGVPESQSTVTSFMRHARALKRASR